MRLAREVIEAGGSAGAVFNAANEIAVEAFLDGRIGFGRITRLAEEALEALGAGTGDVSLDDVMDADARSRRFVAERLGAAAV